MISSFEKLKQTLSRTKRNIFGNITRVVSHRRINDELLEEIEQVLIEADVGVKATTKLIENLKQKAKEKKLAAGEQVITFLQEEISAILKRYEPLPLGGDDCTPVVWLIVGVNGTGKTTTIAKLASKFSSEDRKVIIAACDTFRPAAIDQLAIWAKRSGVDIIKSSKGSDPAAVAFDAAKAAAARGADILLIDTAGRLHTKTNLMEELKKIRRVISKALPGVPIHSKLIIDSTMGQNAIIQAQVFTEAVGCDGIIVTKLDSTAKGGVIICMAEELGLPVDFVGLGEKIEDLQPFHPEQFARALFADA